MIKGIKPMGTQLAKAVKYAGTAITFRILRRSTRTTAAIWSGCMMEGIAAMIPMWKFEAPRSSANAARNPPDARPSAPDAAMVWKVSVFKPRWRTSSVSVSLGLRMVGSTICRATVA